MHLHGQNSIRRRSRALRPDWDRLDNRCLLSGLSPAAVTSAYGLNAITFTSPNGSTVKGDGAGETIALIEAFHDPTIASDLNTFDQAYGLPNATLTVDDLAGNLSNDGWALEESLDVEWAHAIAPAANILVVEASSQTLKGLITAVNVARNTPGVAAISMSWGFNEFRQETAYNSTFTTPAGHTPITFLASSGDSGSQGGAEWPATAPSVIAVGGTSLSVGSSGQYQFESAWVGSSGGYSKFEAEPAYQRSIQNTGKRSSPDVSFDGDPDTGVSVYETSLETGQGSWQVVGGTSVGSPAWAGIIAIADQGRAATGQGSLNGATQTLPTLYALPSSDFHQVASFSRRGGLLADATANTATGLGTPVGASLISGLVTSELNAPLMASASVKRATAKVSRAKARRKIALAIPERASLLKLPAATKRKASFDLADWD
jgi:subtilase family serine protease